MTTPKDAKQSRRTAPDDEPDFIPLEDRVAATDIGRAIVLHPWIKSGGVGAHLRPGQRAPEVPAPHEPAAVQRTRPVQTAGP